MGRFHAAIDLSKMTQIYHWRRDLGAVQHGDVQLDHVVGDGALLATPRCYGFSRG
jgi:hypothetical protein